MYDYEKQDTWDGDAVEFIDLDAPGEGSASFLAFRVLTYVQQRRFAVYGRRKMMTFAFLIGIGVIVLMFQPDLISTGRSVSSPQTQASGPSISVSSPVDGCTIHEIIFNTSDKTGQFKPATVTKNIAFNATDKQWQLSSSLPAHSVWIIKIHCLVDPDGSSTFMGRRDTKK